MEEYASEERRNDPELRDAVLIKLVKHREELKRVIALMDEAYAILDRSDNLERPSFGGRHNDALAHLRRDSGNLNWYVKHILADLEEETASGRSAYVGNKAAFLSPERAEKLKQEYREGKI